MSRKSWFGCLFARSHRSAPCGRQSRLAFEPLEQRTLLTTLTVDIGDPTADDAGDNLYAQISEAVSTVSPGDMIKVHSGTYNPFVVNTDNLTIREANANSNPVVDGDLKPSDASGESRLGWLGVARVARLSGPLAIATVADAGDR